MEQIIIIDPQLAYWTEVIQEITQKNIQIHPFSTFTTAQKTLEENSLLLVILHTSIPDMET
jgi:hypothetical protein